MGSQDALSIITNTGGGFYPGDGIGIPASFTAPAAGTYYFELRVSAQAYMTKYLVGDFEYAQIQTPSYLFTSTDFFQVAGSNTNSQQTYYVSCTVPLTLGQQVTFNFLGPSAFSGPPGPAFTILGTYDWPTGGGPLNYVTTVSGFLVTAISAPSPAGTVCFAAYQAADYRVPHVPLTPPIAVSPYIMGSGSILGVTENEGAAFYPGDGAGTGALFTAPVNGNYFFNFTAQINHGHVNGQDQDIFPGSFYIQIVSPTLVYSVTDSTFASGAPGPYDYQTFVISVTIPLTASQQVFFRILGRGSGTVASGWDYIVNGPYVLGSGYAPYGAQLNYSTLITGYLI
jgi:hypothetical protein